jgi:hypothetical protein
MDELLWQVDDAMKEILKKKKELDVMEGGEQGDC